MKRKDIEFSAEDLVVSAEDFAKHLTGTKKLTLRTRTLKLPPRIKPIKPKEIAAIRQKLSASQAVFARLLNVPTITAVSWEHGRRKPTGAALRLLDLARRKPEILTD